MTNRYDVAIVGGGFSGAMLAARMVTMRRKHAVHVVLIDRAGRFGRGVAYSTSNPRHLLNVPVGGMSAIADEPDHFLKWARRRISELSDGTYLPRSLYGDYVASVLDDALRHRASRSTIELRVGAARRIDFDKPGPAGFRVHLEDGDVFAHKVVLAAGNSAPRRLDGPAIQVPEERTRYVPDPWAPGALDAVPGAGDVVIVGTGLTMIDVALELIASGHRGRLIAISRRGLLPQPHLSTPQPPGTWLGQAALADPRPSRLMRAVRDAVGRAAAEGCDWRRVVAELRPVTPALWRRMGERGQATFLRHAAPYWETHRHRAPPAIHDVLLGLLATGQLEVRAASLFGVEQRGTSLVARVRPRGASVAETLSCAALVNCMGPDPDVRRTSDPLMASLLAAGWIRPGPLSLGIDVDDDGAAIGRDGVTSKVLYAVGPLRRGRLYETTAVPELRVQVGELAALLDPDASVPA